jgi:hypothetical protein
MQICPFLQFPITPAYSTPPAAGDPCWRCINSGGGEARLRLWQKARGTQEYVVFSHACFQEGNG